MSPKTSSEKAYADAYHQLVDLLEKPGDGSPHEVAREFMQALVRAGWRHVRPTVDVPGTGRVAPAAPEVREAALADARARLAEGGGR